MNLFATLILVFFLIGEKPNVKIYSEGEYIFSVKIFENDKEIYLRFNEPYYLSNEKDIYENAWELGDDKNIYFLGLEMMDGNVNSGQKAIRWNYYNSDFIKLDEEITGLIENDSVIWLHPPRTKYFKILEINPFPEVRFHESEWSTDLTVGSEWGNERWKTWKGNLKVSSEYSYEKEIGVVTSKAETEIGTTKLISEFNPEKGFTKFDYTNINGSRILLELIEVKE